MAVIGAALGVADVPRSRVEAEAAVAAMRPALAATARSAEVAAIVLAAKGPSRATQGVQRLATQAAVDLLPDWARAMHGLSAPRLSAPLVRAGVRGVAGTLRWAFR